MGRLRRPPPVQNSYSVVIETDITGNLNSGLQKFTENTTQVNFQMCAPNCNQFSLGEFWQNADYGPKNDGSDCFPVGGVLGSIQVSKSRKNPDAAAAVFWFKSIYVPTQDEVKYQLTITGGWEGVFPPPEKDDYAIMTATAWKMQTEGKGQHRNTACKGESDNDSINVALVVTNITP